MIPILLAVTLLPLLALLWHVWNLLVLDKRFRAFGGPASARWLEWWHARAMISGEYNQRYSEVLDQYGHVARVGPNDLITNSPELLMRMNSPRAGYTKGEWFYRSTRVEPGRDHIFSQCDEKAHKDRRAAMAAGYAQRNNPAVEATVEGHIQNLLSLIRMKYLSTSTHYRPMDLAQKVHFLALDVITDLSYGSPIGDLTSDEDNYRHLEATGETLGVLSFFVATGLMKILLIPRVHRMMFSEQDEKGWGKFQGTVRKLIQARSQNKTSSKADMADAFMKHGLSENDCVTEATLQIVAGADAVATVLRCTMLLLISNPGAYRKLQEEVDAEVRRSCEVGSVVKSADAAALPYLQAVIKEGTRTFPPATDFATKQVPPEGDVIEIEGQSVTLPGGARVTNAAWSMMHRKDIFGDDAEAFRPERWLEAEGNKLTRMNKTVDLIFGYGKYQCLGMSLATIEINKALFELTRNFDFAIVNPSNPWKSVNHMGVWFQKDLMVTVTAR